MGQCRINSQDRDAPCGNGSFGWGLFPVYGEVRRERRGGGWCVSSRTCQKALQRWQRQHRHGHCPETPERASVKIELQRGRGPVPAGSGSHRRATHCAAAVSGCSVRDFCTWALTTKVQILEQKPN